MVARASGQRAAPASDKHLLWIVGTLFFGAARLRRRSWCLRRSRSVARGLPVGRERQATRVRLVVVCWGLSLRAVVLGRGPEFDEQGADQAVLEVK